MERGQLLGTEKVWLRSQFTESRHLEHKLRRVEPLVLAGLLGQGISMLGGGGGQSYVEGVQAVNHLLRGSFHTIGFLLLWKTPSKKYLMWEEEDVFVDGVQAVQDQVEIGGV